MVLCFEINIPRFEINMSRSDISTSRSDINIPWSGTDTFGAGMKEFRYALTPAILHASAERPGRV